MKTSFIPKKILNRIALSIFAAMMAFSLYSCVVSSPVATYGRPTNIVLPPWAPENSMNVEYYYFPDYEIYYDTWDNEFAYLENGAWMFSPVLPPYLSGIDLYSAYIVMLDAGVHQPWMHHDIYLSHYPRYYYHTMPQYREGMRGYNENGRGAIFIDRDRMNRREGMSNGGDNRGYNNQNNSGRGNNSYNNPNNSNSPNYSNNNGRGNVAPNNSNNYPNNSNSNTQTNNYPNNSGRGYNNPTTSNPAIANPNSNGRGGYNNPSPNVPITNPASAGQRGGITVNQPQPVNTPNPSSNRLPQAVQYRGPSVGQPVQVQPHMRNPQDPQYRANPGRRNQ